MERDRGDEEDGIVYHETHELHEKGMGWDVGGIGPAEQTEYTEKSETEMEDRIRFFNR